MRIRNPFLLLASEQIDFESAFLGLFDPGILNIFQNKADSLWNRVYNIRSAPGGGKTTLLRLFTPSSLKSLHNLRHQQGYREIYEKLKSLDVLDEDGIHTLGIMLSCSRIWRYADIEDLHIDIDEQIDAARKRRLFFSLLNSRIIISALKGITTLLDLPSNGLDSIYIRTPEEDIPGCYPTNCRGSELFGWAQEMEERICGAIDDLAFTETNGELTDSALSSLYIINPKNILVDDSPIIDHVIVMLDDFHQLIHTQREYVKDMLKSSRPPVGIWISERPEVLSVEELIAEFPYEEAETYWGLEKFYVEASEIDYQLPGDQIGRDIVVIWLEQFWKSNRGKFKQTILSIANRRIGYADSGIVNSFEECLADTLEDSQWSSILANLLENINEKVSGIKKFEGWLNIFKELSDSNYNKAILLRTMEILMERDRQTTLDDFSRTEDLRDQEIITEDFKEKCKSDIKAAAELFISKDFDLPYYFGWPCIADISFFNLEQFIHLCSYLFEEFLSLSLLDTSNRPLAPSNQERVLKKGIEEIMNDKLEKIPEGEKIVNFIDSIGKYSNLETYRPNAPYPPGVTGVGIKMDDIYFLIQHKKRNDSVYRKYKDLMLVIAECIKKNLLMPWPNYKCKGKLWMVLYLNRMLCVKYDLPLQYGGWRDRTINELNAWAHEKTKSRLRP